MDDEKFDVIIVGAGPAGAAAALTLARAGVLVAVFERGEYPGSKNLFGGILFTSVLQQLLPGFWEKAPLERHVVRRRFSLLGTDTEMAADYQTYAYDQPPYNHSYTVIRARFDPWFAAQAEEAGAFILPETVVDDFLWEEGRIVGVRTRREEGDLRADVVVVAEGANSFLAQRGGFRKEFDPARMQMAVKETLALPHAVIEDRFALEGDEGCAYTYLGGDAVQGMFGGGFIYTHRDRLSVGISCTLKDFVAHKRNPAAVLEHFKQHPCVRKLLRGSETVEYSGHMIPEFGRETMPHRVGPGVIFTGDAAGLVNFSPFYHEGANLAMASGVFAAETILELKARAVPFTTENLAVYEQKLAQSFVLQDVEKFRNIPDFGARHPQFFNKYPYVFTDLAREFFSINGQSKSEVERRLGQEFKQKVGWFPFLRDLLHAGRALR